MSKNQNSIANMDLENFDDSIEKFIEAAIQYTRECVEIAGFVDAPQASLPAGAPSAACFLQVNVKSEVPKEIWRHLANIVHYFVQICETHGKFKPFLNRTPETHDFYSGMLFVDNVLKHKNRDIEISDLIYPILEIEVRDEFFNSQSGSIKSIPLDQTGFRFAAQWVEIKEDIVNAMVCKNRYKNYKDYLEGRDVIETVSIAMQIVKILT